MTDLGRLKRAALAGGDPEAARAYLRELERRGRLARWEWLVAAVRFARWHSAVERRGGSLAIRDVGGYSPAVQAFIVRERMMTQWLPLTNRWWRLAIFVNPFVVYNAVERILAMSRALADASA